MIHEVWTTLENPFPTKKQLTYMEFMENELRAAGIIFANGGTKCKFDRAAASRRCQYLGKVAAENGLPDEWESIEEEKPEFYKPYSAKMIHGYKKLSARTNK